MNLANLPKVTPENYFSFEIQMAYMGASQLKSFSQCEAATLAELRGEYVPAISTALLVGSYVDAYFSDELQLFHNNHPEIFKRDGQLKVEYLHAQDIINRMEDDELYSLLMSGKKQVIRTGFIAGVPFKIKIDSLLDAAICEDIVNRFPGMASALGMCDGAIVDQKVMRSTGDVWSDTEGCNVSFVEGWGYDLQGAIYQAIEGHMLPFILAVGTKEDPPDLMAVHLRDNYLEEKFCEVEDIIPRFQAIKEGLEAPRRCGRCAYCRGTKKLTNAVSYP